MAKRSLVVVVLIATVVACSPGVFGGDDPIALRDERGGSANEDAGAASPNGTTSTGGGDAASPRTTGDSGGTLPSGEAGAPDSAGVPDGPPSGVRDFTQDRNLFFGASRCGAAGTRLCEDFESGSIDASTWQVQGTTPVIDAVHAARGTRALHVTKAQNGASRLSHTKSFPFAQNKYFGRAFFYFTGVPHPPDTTFAHWTMIAATGTGVQGEIRIGGIMSNAKNLFGVGTDSGGAADGTGDWTWTDRDPSNNPAVVPVGQWVCIEWLHDGSANETRFYWDALEHTSLHTTSSSNGGNGKPYVLPNFDAFWIGWDEYQSSPQTFELWVDEVALDTQRIGCVL
jgi:hypothetical protein